MYTALTLRKLAVVCLLMALLGSTVGQVFAQVGWQSTQLYQSDTLKGSPNGKSWSPTSGQLSGKVLWEGGQRRTYAEANYQKWDQATIDWMRANSGTPSITFHIFDYTADNCTNWTSIAWSYTNLPGSTLSQPLRWCGYNESRVQADKSRLTANTNYVAQVTFYDKSPSNRAKVVVDTYWDGSGNYHQHYCIPNNQDTALNRNNCG